LDIRLYVERIIECKFTFIKELNFVYNTLLVIYNPDELIFERVIAELKTIYNEEKIELFKTKKWTIPVSYDSSFGIDLELISNKLTISIGEIIDLHTSALYTIHGIGFLPGFLYLGGLHEKLHFPRLTIPRPNIIKGAVGIGGIQTGIYPQESPGGWNIIGNTPLPMFDIHKKPPCLFIAGDKIKFKSVSLDEYGAIKNEVKKGTYQLKYQEL
jgi:inhibitor of KinA